MRPESFKHWDSKILFANVIKIHSARTIPFPVISLNRVSEDELIDHASNRARLWIWSSPSSLIFN